MFDLVKFEFKKIVARRSTFYTCVAIVALLCVIMAMNVLQTKTTSNTDEILSGFDAIHQRQANAEARAGVLTDERIADELSSYYDLAFSQLDPEAIAAMSDAAAYDAVKSTYGVDGARELYGSGYWSWLFGAWSDGSKEPIQMAALLGPVPAVSFYDALAMKTQAILDDGQGGSWEYSDAERSYWTQKQGGVPEPIVYGYAGGWENIMDCMAFVIFAILAVCVALAPMFAAEYQERTDSVILSSRYGRSRLVAAKFIAAFLFTTAYFALCVGIICAVSLCAYGADGADLPVQILAVSSPYGLTMAQCVVIMAGIAYLMTLGFAALTLLLSSKLHSLLSIFAIDVAAVLLTGMIPTGGSGLLVHLSALFPANGLVAPTMFWRYMSYPIGDGVVDLIGMQALAYGILFAVCVPLAAIAFRRHQVA
ncbi:MAG: ABC transporter permease subunit [Slackia sp.]|nr:ABC transporter permease subunit [Slackia sp.]